MLGSPLGAAGLGGAYPFDDRRFAAFTITGVATVSFHGFSTSRQITDTDILQMPVNVVLAEQAIRDPRGRLKEPGTMTKSMMRKIFGDG